MQLTITNTGRWMLTLLLVACFSSTAVAQRTVTLQLNTASLPDTTGTDSVIQVRGCLAGCEGDLSDLPDGNILAWGDTTSLVATNDGGDFWSLSFQVPDTSEVAFKFFSDQAENGGSGIGGWEDGDNHVLAAGAGDTTMTLHFFEKGDDKAYDWRPFESKEDSVGVWFRVYMNTEASVQANYDPANTDMVIGVRGAPEPGSVINWDSTALSLAQEVTDDDTKPGYHLWSGVAYYPATSIGTEQAYKFVVETETTGWEGTISDRTFTVPTQDSTLHFSFFDDSPAISGSGPVTATVLFAVDLTPLETIGIFDRGRGDTLEVRGEFNGWGCDNPDNCLLQRIPGEDIFEAAIPVTAIATNELQYKYFLNFNDSNFVDAFGDSPPNGWEEPISRTGANRIFAFEGNESSDQDLGVQFFNDVLNGNIVPEGSSIDVTFHVRMDSALVDDADPFVPGEDTVTIDLTGDAIWAFTQGVPRDGDGNFQVDPAVIALTDDDADGVYSGTMTLNGPSYAAIQYKYAYGGSGTFAVEAGGSFGDAGRRRTRYITPNADGSWPDTWEFEVEVYQSEGVLPFEPNPVATSVEQVDGELPSRIALEANYPNPFNPETTIEYSINTIEHVKLRVYDITGRLVATLVDGIQPASNYRVTFDANNLASGMYLYRLQAGNQTITRKMMLVK